MTLNQRGSITIETLLLVPAMFIFGTFIIYVGRMTDAALTVRRAADVAARIASESSSEIATSRATRIARQEMSLLKSGCDSSDIDVRRAFRNEKTTYEVRVQCTINIRGLGLLAIAPRSVSAESSEIVDLYTSR
jgi:Flp pilus assembly protein TadG